MANHRDCSDPNRSDPERSQPDQQDIVAAPVTSIMRAPVFTVFDSVILMHALAAMIATGRRHLAVVDRHGRCQGVVGDRAVAAAWANDPSSMGHLRVGQLLDVRAAVVGAEVTVGDVARRMHADHIDAVAVIDGDGCPVGIVTGGDLIGLMARAIPSPPAPDPTAATSEDDPS